MSFSYLLYSVFGILTEHYLNDKFGSLFFSLSLFFRGLTDIIFTFSYVGSFLTTQAFLNGTQSYSNKMHKRLECFKIIMIMVMTGPIVFWVIKTYLVTTKQPLELVTLAFTFYLAILIVSTSIFMTTVIKMWHLLSSRKYLRKNEFSMILKLIIQILYSLGGVALIIGLFNIAPSKKSSIFLAFICIDFFSVLFMLPYLWWLISLDASKF
jgi:hypothetical protein